MHFNPRGYRLWADAQLVFLLDPAHALLPEGFCPPEETAAPARP